MPCPSTADREITITYTADESCACLVECECSGRHRDCLGDSDSMEAQLQIRQNALEAQDYMQDLLGWQQTLKDKSSKEHQQATADRDVPAVRGRASGSVGSAPDHMQQPLIPSKPAQAAAPRTTSPAAHTYKNYSKWDKYDVDAALSAPDHGSNTQQQAKATASGAGQHHSPAIVQQPADHSSNSGAAPKVAPLPPPTAAGLKDRGNKLYQAGYFSDAISCYRQSLELQPSSITYANRAIAHIKLGQYAEAEQDCTAALQLDPTYVKAYHRRGTAHKQLGKLLEAAADFEEALRLEPANKTLLADRDNAIEQYLQQQKIPSSNTWSNIPVHQQVAETAALDKVQLAPAITGAPVVSPTIKECLPQTQQETTAADVPAAALHDSSTKQQQPDATAQSSPPPAAPAAGDATSKAGSDGRIPAVLSRTSSSGAPAAAAGATSPARASSPRGAAATAAAEAAAAQLAARLAAGLKAPRTSNDFEAAWRSFRGDQGLQAKYLKLLSPQQLPAVFKTSLTAPILTAILTVALKAAANADRAGHEGADLGAAHAVALIEQFVKVPRFDMTIMCLTTRDKAALKQLWSAAVDSCVPGLQNSLLSVRTKYRL